ncbi:MAG: pyridoxal-phosphate dependent enzyme [Anaerolineae bacterium]
MDTLYVRTPIIDSLPLSRRWGRPVYLKLESAQPSGSFKNRALGALCQAGAANGATRFVSSSGGNAGFSAAYCGRRLGLPVTVFVPSTTQPRFHELIAAQGADVRVAGAVWDETHAAAVAFAEQTGALYVHPFDHPTVWRGNATMIDEIAEDFGKPGAVICSVGGGGLLCGVAEGLERQGWHDVPILAVETEGAASFAASLKAGRLVTLDRITSIATTLGAKTVTPQALAWAQQRPIASALVSDAQAVAACVAFADDHRILVEPACGASLAVAYEGMDILPGADPVVIIVCGGVGVDTRALAAWAA